MCSPDVNVTKLDVYHLDEFPGNGSTHSPIFATIELDANEPTPELTAEVKEGLESPFSNYLSRKRPNWDCIDMDLFHKLSNIKSDAVWHTIAKERADIRLNAIVNILVRSALDASAGKQASEINIESGEMKKLKYNMKSISQKLKTLRTKDGKVIDDSEEAIGNLKIDKDILQVYKTEIGNQRRCRRKINSLQ